jgi:hypothetical protein
MWEGVSVAAANAGTVYLGRTSRVCASAKLFGSVNVPHNGFTTVLQPQQSGSIMVCQNGKRQKAYTMMYQSDKLSALLHTRNHPLDVNELPIPLFARIGSRVSKRKMP